MHLELPDYVINRNLIKAVRKNNAVYVKGALNCNPWLRDALFYSEAMVTNVGPFDHTYRPPVYFLNTLFAYAILANSKKVLMALKDLQADIYRSCYVADVLDDGEEPCYRVLELPPIALCQPTDAGLSSAIEVGYDAHGNIIVVTTIYHGNEAEDAVVQYRGYWEFCISARKRTHNAQSINEVTNHIIPIGYDVNILLKQLDLCKLFSRYYYLTVGKGFRNTEYVIRACELFEILLRHGCSFTDRNVTHNMFKALQELIRSPHHSTESRDRLTDILRTIVLLSPDGRALRELESPLLSRVVRSVQTDTLVVRCIRQIRFMLGGQFFLRHVQSLPCSDEVKSLITYGRKRSKR
ncbi:unnamed protein product [Echinostoma caproni]|uniref:DNA-directed RNA polymerase n=1 Tax=Echinostoma caproni TaxID=27848 RepID=A0A183AJ01_9TREM|nr:unnamed protein product [Echinostoma caproni]